MIRSKKQCDCEPAESEDAAEHDAECPRGYGHLKTAKDVALFRQCLMIWDEHTRGRVGIRPDLTARMAEGVTARAIELGLERP